MAQNELLRDLESELLLFGKIIMPSTFWAESPAVHYDIESILLDPEKLKVNLILPRGTAKTTLAGEVKPMHHIFVENQGSPKFVVIVSKTQSHSKDRLRKIKDVITDSAQFKAIFGEWGESTAIAWRDDMIVLKNKTVILTRGLGQPIRGLNMFGMRPTLIILDDPEDENNTKTPEAMEANLRWLLQGALPALDERGGTSKCIIIGTPLNQRCMVETVNDMDDWFTFRRSYLNKDEDGNYWSLWEAKKTVQSLIAERDSLIKIGRGSVFMKERQCMVTGDEDQIFKESYLKYYAGELIQKGDQALLKVYYIKNSKLEIISVEERLIPVNVFMGVDPASSTRRSADYSVVFPIAVDADLNIYCLPYFRKRVTPFTLGSAVLSCYLANEPRLTRIESTGYQEMLREHLQREQERLHLYIAGLEIKETPRDSKSSRLESMEPEFYQGKVYLLESMEEFKTELLMYPRGKNDDTLDGFYYARKKIYTPFHSADPLEEDDDDYYTGDTSWVTA
jgi:hypothetical protein